MNHRIFLTAACCVAHTVAFIWMTPMVTAAEPGVARLPGTSSSPAITFPSDQSEFMLATETVQPSIGWQRHQESQRLAGVPANYHQAPGNGDDRQHAPNLDARIGSPSPELATAASSANIELTAYHHLKALNANQFARSQSTGGIEQGHASQSYATQIDHAVQIRPVMVFDDDGSGAGVDPVAAPEQLPTPDFYEDESYNLTCGPGCTAHHHGGWLWTFGVEETFLVPDRDGTQASVLVTSPFETFSATPKESMELGPRLWFGIQKPHWQLLGRMWLLNSVDNEFDPVLLGTGDRRGSLIDNDVQAFTVDFEVQRLFIGADCWNHYLGFGYRFASLEDVSRVSATSLDTTNPIAAVVQADAFALSKFDGSGLTVSFGATKPLHVGCCAQLDFFYNLRGSMCWGNVDTAAQTSVVVLDPNIPGTANRFDAAAATGRDELFIGELQVGTRWTHQLKCVPGVAFFHAAFEYQWWDVDGGIAFSESAALVNANSGLATAVSGPNTEISLIGFALGAGMIW